MSDNNLIGNWREALFNEGGLLSNYFGYYFKVGGKHDRLLVAICTAVIFVLCICGYILWPDRITSDRLYKTVETLAPIFVNISVGLLGFLIAAFAIFMSTTSHTLLIQLAKLKHGKTEMSEFRFILISYMSIFLDFVLLLIFSTICFVATTDKGVFRELSYVFSERTPVVAGFVNVISLCALLALAVQATFQLKSFLINLFQGLVLYVATLKEPA